MRVGLEGLVLTQPVSTPDFQALPSYGSPEIFSRGCSKADRCGGTESGRAPLRAAFARGTVGRMKLEDAPGAVGEVSCRLSRGCQKRGHGALGHTRAACH